MVSSRTTSGTAGPRSPPSASAGGTGMVVDDATPSAEAALVAALRAPDAATRLRAVRKLKNDVIANRGRKARFIAAGAAPALVAALRDALGVGSGGGAATPMETDGGGAGEKTLGASNDRRARQER